MPNTIAARPSPLRVLHVGHGRLFGGVETMLVAVARHRDLCAEMVPEFAVCFEGRLADEVRDTGAAVHLLGETRVSRPWSVVRARRALRSLLRSRRYDVVVCHSVWPHAVFGPVAMRAGVRLAFWQHGGLAGRHWTEHWAARCRPSLAISNSRFSARTLPHVFPGVPHAVVYCPVPAIATGGAPERAAVRAEFDTPQSAVVVAQVSRMESWKGHQSLLEALGAVGDGVDWACWLVGGAQRASEAAYERRLRDAARALRIADRVRFCGQRTDVPRVLRAADVFCQPNTGAEPFGVTFVEALYAGLPVAATALGGALEIVDESCGALVAPHDVAGLAGLLRPLLVDRSLRARLGAAGPARARALCDPAARLHDLHSLLDGARRTHDAGTPVRARTARRSAEVSCPP